MTQELAAGTRSEEVRGEDGQISRALLENIASALDDGRRDILTELTEPVHEADLADILEALNGSQRKNFVELLGSRFDFRALIEVDDRVREEILDILPTEVVVEGVRDLDSDDAVYILEDLEEGEQQEILDKIPEQERVPLKRALDYPEDSAGRLMQSEFIAVPPFWTVGDAIDHMRDTDDLPNDFYEVFIVDPAFKPVGTVALNVLLRSKRPVRMDEIMDSDIHTVVGDLDQEEVARAFERYNLVSLAVTDEAGRMAGVLTVDDIIDVIEEEAEEDIHRLGGVGDEEISDSVVTTARNRFVWLFVNLITAVVASWVISLFDATLTQMVALAILMPIVASMGGNAGTQTMTVAVRALATQDLAHFNISRVVTREVLVGLVNGVLFALVLGVVAGVWFGNAQLGGVIGVAMVVNMLVAGLFGILVPISLHRMKLDPAIASGSFVTFITDVVGFLAFLGLAAWWFGLV